MVRLILTVIVVAEVDIRNDSFRIELGSPNHHGVSFGIRSGKVKGRKTNGPVLPESVLYPTVEIVLGSVSRFGCDGVIFREHPAEETVEFRQAAINQILVVSVDEPVHTPPYPNFPDCRKRT